MSSFHDPIFRGCTRPAMSAGVPMLAFLLVTGTFMLVAAWTFYLASAYLALFIGMAYAPILISMRAVTRKDDQRLRQLLLRLRMRLRHLSGRSLWGAISYSPLRFTKRRPA